jgi:hypothetical protein
VSATLASNWSVKSNIPEALAATHIAGCFIFTKPEPPAAPLKP